ncbi:protein translocase subunit SecF [Sulfobacillus harzensis]|uniref:Protein-export membrane protein SecF n=1 Tax=Sulfobacillus harzensis TaxID=2729629 RepID=A0A7Y0L392_9FIRM|nr:protein translocase subunit SecF [Sulfobacillus harzensis]NMP22512.1 protein translocase subunit SecF [Sulfobacillus harzensis]
MTTSFHWDFLKNWKVWFGVSGLLLLVGLFGIFVRGLNYGIDFTGGTQFDLKFSHAISTVSVRRVLDSQHLNQSTIVYIGKGNREVLITTPTISEHERGVLLTQMKTVAPYQEVSTSRVSSIIGQQTERTALLAVVLATVAIILYITIRFEFRFAMAGIIALLLDVIVTVGMVALIHVVLTKYFIMAVLTIFGYSMNDRIIVFDRIRENLHKQRKNEPLEEVVNRSLNQVLMRSINTSTTVMLALAALLALGGSSIRDFSVTMLIGVFFGTFTSLFIASPVWFLWRKRDDAHRKGAPKPA